MDGEYTAALKWLRPSKVILDDYTLGYSPIVNDNLENIMSISAVDFKPTTSPISQAQSQKATLNVSILEATEVKLGAKNKPLALTLRTIIDELNTVLEPSLGPDAIDAAVKTGLDVSPEATADRIVSLATAFFPAFQKSNPDESEEEALTHFMDVIRSGIERGFAEARQILQGLSVLEGSIASNIDLTYDLVQEKLGAFQQSFYGREDVA